MCQLADSVLGSSFFHFTDIPGVDPTITFSQVSSQGSYQGFKSPLLLCSAQKSWMRFKYEVASPSLLRVHSRSSGYRDLGGRSLTGMWQAHTSVDRMVSTTTGYRCVQLTNRLNRNRCQSFRVTATVSVDCKYVTISDITFGDRSICEHSFNTKKTFKCNFDDDDCGVRNDACGLVDWDIRYNDSSSLDKPSSLCSKHVGVPLLKQQIRESCSYDDLNIVKLQQSGFTQFTTSSRVTRPFTSTTAVLSRHRRTFGYSLYLVPSQIGGVAIGILNLPIVVHHDDNSYLKFECDMIEDGFHDLMVTAVCLSDPSRSLIPLGQLGLHFHVTHLTGKGISHSVCLDLHSKINIRTCSQFAIQIKAAAVQTAIIVDDFEYLQNLKGSYCGK